VVNAYRPFLSAVNLMRLVWVLGGSMGCAAEGLIAEVH